MPLRSDIALCCIDAHSRWRPRQRGLRSAGSPCRRCLPGARRCTDRWYEYAARLGAVPPRSWLRWDPCSREAGQGCRHVRCELPRPVTGAVRISIPSPAVTCGRAVSARVRCALREGRLSSFWRGGVALTLGLPAGSIGTRSRSRRGRTRPGGRGGVRGLRHRDRPGLRPGAVSTVGFPGSTGSPQRARSPRHLRRTR
jgi:hypothetical protein